jgi:NAD(P)-dependent dehydrogenase (short-subunit alcohol dehydrogenase family)
MGRLDAKVAVVTGGGSGIGLASVRRLAEDGATLVVVDLDRDSAEKAAGEFGGLAIQADVSRPEAWNGIVDAVIERFGRVDVAHLNAGVMTGESDITKLTDDAYRRIVGVNVDGVVFGVRALVPPMSTGGGGAIVATASLAGLIGFSPDPLYCVTKHAVVGLVRSLVPQLSDRGITINAVCPSIVDTPLIDDTRVMLNESGFPLIDAAVVADAVFDCVVGDETGNAMVIQAGREALPFRFGRPPGPRAGGTVGQMPPEQFAAHDQG